MRINNAMRFGALISLLAACSDTPGTVDYTVQVKAIEIVQKGGEARLDAAGLPSASGRLVAPNRGRYPSQAP
jgi:hypothetical protein